LTAQDSLNEFCITSAQAKFVETNPKMYRPRLHGALLHFGSLPLPLFANIIYQIAQNVNVCIPVTFAEYLESIL
jgi:hypothetical protein